MERILILIILCCVHVLGVFGSANVENDPLNSEQPTEDFTIANVHAPAETISDHLHQMEEDTDFIQEKLKYVLQEEYTSQTTANLLGAKMLAAETLDAAPFYNVTMECANATRQIVEGLLSRENFAMQMLDAMAKLPSGVMEGNMNWHGAYEQCMNVTAPNNSFTGKYCSASISGLFPQGIIPGLGLIYGACMPSTCDNVSVAGIMNAALSALGEKVPGVPKIATYYVQCQEPNVLDNGAIAALVIIGFLVLFVAIGTLYDIIIRCAKAMAAPEYDVNGTEEERTRLLDGSVKVQTPPPDDKGKGVEHYIQAKGAGESVIPRILLSFSAITNGGNILMVGNIKKDISCLHGMRVLSMWWVILGHSYAFSIYNLQNILSLASILKRFSFQTIGNATVSVDSFFFLSGLLVTFLLMKELKAKDGRTNWAIIYFHRFWRLTPAYMFVLMFYTTIPKYLNPGPMSAIFNSIKNPCVDYWWTNLLYINNFYPTQGALGQCFGWGWYLANDMQFFIITPPIVYILYRSRWAGLTLIAALILACLISTGVISSFYEVSVNAVGVPPINPNTTTGFDLIYTKPYTRVAPYAVGMLAGYILFLTDCKKVYRSRHIRLYAVLAWLAAAAICLSVLYGCYYYVETSTKMGVDLSAFYNSVSRFAWSVGLLIVVVACVHGYGGPVDAILSWEAWVPLSRLTYCAYLVHPVLIFIYVMGSKVALHYDDLGFAYLFVGHLVLSYACAFITSLLIEAPMMGLEKIIFKK